jgi:hypothetical protein
MLSLLKTIIFSCILLLATNSSWGLSPMDMAKWPIVCSKDASASEQYAAEEFQTLFEGLTGNKLPILEGVPHGASVIYIGSKAVAFTEAFDALEEDNEETLRISLKQNTLSIDGTGSRGTLYGVYEFFEEWCGVRFLTKDHTYFPEDAKDRILPLGTKTHTPTFAFRWSYYGETNRNPSFATRIRTNTLTDEAKFGGRTGFRLVGHNVSYLLPPSKYGKEHPEYYALVDGERKLSMHGGGPQLCMTNPEVLDLVTEAVFKEIEKNPQARNINVAHMDNFSFCTCENCAAVDAREESHAGATIAFVNAVAERVAKVHPGVFIGTYAYQYTRKPPKNLTVSDNVMIQLCSIECCTLHPINDPNCELNTAFCQDMDIWKTKAKNIFIWHYNTNFKGYLLPYPNLHSIGETLKYYSENNGQGIFMQAAGNGYSTELSDLRNYVMSRCLWKPGRNSWEEALEFCRLHYSGAAPVIIEYLHYYHTLVEDSGAHPNCFPTEASLAITPDSARTIFNYFQQALASSENSTVHARVEKASLCAYRAIISGAAMKLVHKDGISTPDLKGLDTTLLKQYAALTKKYQVSKETEHTSNQLYLEQMEKLFAGMPSVTIENDLWRVVLIPGSNAKVVEMTYKPTNRNVIQAARAFERFRYEEWVNEGEGPLAQDIAEFEVTENSNDKMILTLTTPNGTIVERSIFFTRNAVRFETQFITQSPRMYYFKVHPEYDTATHSSDPDIMSVYVKNSTGKWTQANAGWVGTNPTISQLTELRESVVGGEFAYYNHESNFGITQQFNPAQYSAIELFWGIDRKQVNLIMHTREEQLAAGQSAGHAYEVRYLERPPISK